MTKRTGTDEALFALLDAIGPLTAEMRRLRERVTALEAEKESADRRRHADHAHALAQKRWLA